MRFSAPSGGIFLIALIVAVGAVLTQMRVIGFVPLEPVWIMAVAYAVLAAGCIIKGA